MPDQHDHQNDGVARIAELVKGVRIAMLTHTDSQGRLVSHPMATQDVEWDGDVLFIGERDSDKVRDLQRNPAVNLAYSGDSSWVSVSGEAEIVDDRAVLEEQWNLFTDVWLDGGPDNPDNVLIRVKAHTAEYWDSPGAKVTQVANVMRAKLTGDTVHPDNEVVDL
jgi:general stress protein 26